MTEQSARLINFTVKNLEKIQAPIDTKQVYYSDTQERYLRLSVGRAGSKSFIFSKKVDGVPRRLTLGPFPGLSIEQARAMVASLRHRIANGENPFDEGLKERTERTVDDLFHDYLENHAKKKTKTWEVIQKDYARNIGTLRRKKAVAVSGADARSLHSALKDQRGPYTANRTIQLMRAVFNKASKRGLFDGPNPFTSVDLEPEQPRDRFLSSKEIQRLLSALDQVNSESAEGTYPYFRDFIWMSILTGQRRSNVLAMHFDDVNFESMTWNISAEQTKSRSKYVVALGPRELEIVYRRKQALKGGYVFPGNGKTGHIVEPKRAWTSLRKIVLGDSSESGKKRGAEMLKGDQGFTLHDLRRSLGSALVSKNVSVALIKGALNHKDVKTTLKHYAYSSKDAEREAKQLVHTEWFESSEKVKIVPLKRNSK